MSFFFHQPQVRVMAFAACGFAFVLGTGCRRETTASRPSIPVRSATTDYPLVGIVREVKPESGQVILRHDDIPGFMKAMTMPFSIADSAVLDDLRVGDEVEGTLHVRTENGRVADYQLRDLVVSK